MALTPLDVFVTGHGGMVGSPLMRRLASEHSFGVLTEPRSALDLTDGRAVHAWPECNGMFDQHQ